MACRYQKVDGCKGSENKPICRDSTNHLFFQLLLIRDQLDNIFLAGKWIRFFCRKPDSSYHDL